MNEVLDFYDSSGTYEFDIAEARNGTVQNKKLYLPTDRVHIGNDIRPGLVELFGNAVETLYSSIKPVNINQNGYEYVFEIGHIPSADTASTSLNTLRAATYQSSLTGNKGNGFEAAADFVFNPRRGVAYVASMGMGLSSALTGPEITYLKKYGRLLSEDENGNTVALPVVHALAKALDKTGIEVDSIYSDSAGALLTVAYGAAHGKGTIKTAHQNVRTGIWDRSPWQLAKGLLVTDRKTSKAAAESSPDVFKMRQEILDLTNDHLGAAFKDKNYQPRKSARMLAAYAIGLGKGPLQGDPLLADNIALTRDNPEAKILFSVGRLDPLAASPKLDARMEYIAKTLSESSEQNVMTAIVEGASHNIQTHYPQFLRYLGQAAFRS